MMNKVLLVTGGTGTFGNAVVKRFLKTDIKEIRVFSRDEKKQDDHRHFYKNKKITYHIGDVRDYKSVLNVCDGVDYVFHAAALKQVPSCEFNPLEAIKTNCLGAENVMSAAVECNVKNVVVLSTDKAVYPINSMGMSKAMMEKLMKAKSKNAAKKGTVLCGTRYGNVMASRGSVIPLFIDQIKTGQPITITNPEMTRFMMSIDDAVELVLFAMNNASPGDMFIQKAPSSKIITIAQAIKELLKSNCEVKNIGIRHGEKFDESLITSEEMSVAVDMGDYYKIPHDGRDLHYDGKNIIDSKHIKEGYTSSNTKILNLQELKEVLSKIEIIQNNLEPL